MELERYQHWFSSSADGVTISHETGEDALGSGPLDSRGDAVVALEAWFTGADETGCKNKGVRLWQYIGTVCIVDGCLTIENWSEIMNGRKEDIASDSYHQEQWARVYDYHVGSL